MIGTTEEAKFAREKELVTSRKWIERLQFLENRMNFLPGAPGTLAVPCGSGQTSS